MHQPLKNVRSDFKSSIDMDIEGGSQTGFVSFLSALRALMDGGSKPYVVLQAFDLLSNSLFIGTTSLRVRFLILHTMTITNTVRFISASMSLPRCLHWYYSERVWI